MVMDSAVALQDVAILEKTLLETTPPSVVETTSFVVALVQRYVPAIKGAAGAEKALAALEGAVGAVDLEAMARSDDQIAVRQAPMLAFQLARTRAELQMDAGRREEGLATMEAFIRTLDPSVPQHRQATSALAQMKLPGTAAPALNATHRYGNFSSLEELRGKVVLLDFFAHWCGPCIRSFPDLKALYADLQGDGLEVVAVTTFYGYFGHEKDISKEDEYAKMAGFIQQHELPWPVVYVERDFYAAHGVSGIPHVTVLDREGRIHKIKVGYTPEGFVQFRREVEKLLRG
jgi:thiol-disulfide isomerase/thioredoxin